MPRRVSSKEVCPALFFGKAMYVNRDFLPLVEVGMALKAVGSGQGGIIKFKDFSLNMNVPILGYARKGSKIKKSIRFLGCPSEQELGISKHPVITKPPFEGTISEKKVFHSIASSS